MKWGKIPPPKQNKGGKRPPNPPDQAKVVSVSPGPPDGRSGKRKLVLGSLKETMLRENKTMYQVRKERAQRKNNA